MKYTQPITKMIVLGFILLLSAGSATANCKKVKGHFFSEIVTEFPNGDPCPSPIGFCTVGRFTGGIRGKFTFVGENLVANPDLENPLVQFTTGVMELTLKKGTLTLRDASAVSFDTDGLFGGLQTITSGTGKFSETSGRFSTFGVFDEGCVSCKYKGKICTP
jgi:hypothetical protein